MGSTPGRVSLVFRIGSTDERLVKREKEGGHWTKPKCLGVVDSGLTPEVEKLVPVTLPKAAPEEGGTLGSLHVHLKWSPCRCPSRLCPFSCLVR